MAQEPQRGTRANEAITKILTEFEESCPVVLRDRARVQGQLCLEEAKVALKTTVGVVREQLNNGQKDVSRCLEPHVREQLRDGYYTAMQERGAGSVARQKAIFRNFVQQNKDELFQDGADAILGGLDKIALDVGKALETALEGLANKVEVNLATLWEDPGNHKYLARERLQAVQSIDVIIGQLALWEQAEQMRNATNA